MLKRKAVPAIVSILLLTSMLTVTSNIQVSKSIVRLIVVPDDYPTIQEAINNANEGDTVYVKSGIYISHVVINKTLSLVGENRSSTVIDCRSAFNVAAVTIQANHVVVKNFTIQGPAPFEAGYWGLVITGSNSDVLNNVIRDVHYGIILRSDTAYNKIEDNLIGPCGHALHLQFSAYNQIRRNAITASSGGIYLNQYNHDNLVEDNNIANNHWGIIVQDSWANAVQGNNITSNDIGVHDSYSFDSVPPPRRPSNTFCHNNFVGNGEQVLIGYVPIDSWNKDYPIGGNYWSDYAGTDWYRGPYQNETGSDGIGDTPYSVDENNNDRYPLIYPYGYVPSPDLNGDRQVDGKDIAVVAHAFASYPSHPRWNPKADLDQNSRIEGVDIALVARNFGKTYP